VAANATTAAAAAEPAVQAACGALASEALAKAGVRVDDAFFGAVSSCAGYAARRTCPVRDLEARAAPLLTRCDAALAAAEKAGSNDGNATAMSSADAAQKGFCGDCYWPVLGLIMNEGQLSDTYWCAARGVLFAQQADDDNVTTSNSSSAAPLSPAEAAALAALYDPRVAPRFTSCLANVQGVAAARVVAASGKEEVAPRDPFATAAARAAAPRCWRRDALLRDAAGRSLAAPALRARLQQLTCPGQPKGAPRCSVAAASRCLLAAQSHMVTAPDFILSPCARPDFKPFAGPGGVLSAAPQAQNSSAGGSAKKLVAL
jgi:hypothetical protein